MVTPLHPDQLGGRLRIIDKLVMTLIKRRMELSELIGTYKRAKGEQIVRADIENARLLQIEDWARDHGINPHFARSILYFIIGESCKQQMILFQNSAAGPDDTEDGRRQQLKKNLLELTEAASGFYDTTYDAEFFATSDYVKWEKERLVEETQKLSDREHMLDLGCATGRISYLLCDTFARVTGIDISQHMIYNASQKLKTAHGDRLKFLQGDLEEGVPAESESVSFVVMNLGTGSDVRDLKALLTETRRVLKPGGRFFFSFYNRDALVYKSEFLPWTPSLAALVNTHRECLEVSNEGHVREIFARAYTREEIEGHFSKTGLESTTETFSAISSLLPNDLLTEQIEVGKAIKALDRTLTDTDLGAYIVATGPRT